MIWKQRPRCLVVIDNNYHNFLLLGSFNKSQCELVVYSRLLDLDLGPDQAQI